MRSILLCAVAASLLVAAAHAEDVTTVGPVILDAADSFWRFRSVWETEEVVLPSGEIGHFRFVCPRDFYQKNPTAKVVEQFTTAAVEVIRLPAETSGDWMKPDFDDSSWIRTRGPMLEKSNNHDWKLLLMRGQFEVPDPAKAGEMSLAVSFRGGCMVYLNGQELTRAFMPKGPIDVHAPAEPYPLDVYVNADGYLMHRRENTDDETARLGKRIRKLAVVIPPARLKQGVNVLAVAIHRAPTDARFYLGRTRMSPQCNPPHDDTRWGKIGLAGLKLVADPGSCAVPNVARPQGKGFVAWNQSILSTADTSAYPDPFAAVQPVRLFAARNGTFAGQVIVGHDEEIRGLKVTATDLAGPGKIPASAVRVRFALPDGEQQRDRPMPFDSLEETAPAEVPVYKASGGAVQPVWITVAVPADAPAGDYAGKLAISAEQVKTIELPVNVHVADWTLKDHKEFIARMDIVESPESMAMAYDVPLWSDEHFKLLDKAFSLMAPLSSRTVYLSCVRRTHFGNEHAMVRWYRDEEGRLQPDFSIAEKYLDLAVRHLGKVPGVILYCWEPVESMGHAGGAGGASRTTDKPILYTLVDRSSGQMRPMTGPAWGTPEAKEFWSKLTSGVKQMLDKRGLGESMLFGLVGDCRPTRQAMDDITSGIEGAKWAVHSHYYCVKWQDYDMGMTIALWGVGCSPVDPSRGYGYGWRNPFWINYYPRELSLQSPLVDYRVKIERWMWARSASETVYSKAAGTRGLGRLGADFWPVVKNQRGQRTARLPGRYPEAYWGQLNLSYGVPNLLGMGKDGPVPTIRSEAFRENLQEVEARVFIESALLDPATRALLGEEFARRCQAALDERTRLCLHSENEGLAWFVSSDWASRTGRLFDLAAELARKLK